MIVRQRGNYTGSRGTSTGQIARSVQHKIRRLEKAEVPNTASKQERIQTAKNRKQARQDGAYGECVKRRRSKGPENWATEKKGSAIIGCGRDVLDRFLFPAI